METICLNNNVNMPQLGFGVFQITDEEVCRQSVLNALKTGYRLIDTAACYGNEKAVGTAVRDSGIAREEIFLLPKSGFRMQVMRKRKNRLRRLWKIWEQIIWIFI